MAWQGKAAGGFYDLLRWLLAAIALCTGRMQRPLTLGQRRSKWAPGAGSSALGRPESGSADWRSRACSCLHDG
jgi:hypothetical protein